MFSFRRAVKVKMETITSRGLWTESSSRRGLAAIHVSRICSSFHRSASHLVVSEDLRIDEPPPPPTPTKLIVYLAFVRDEEGALQPAFEAREAQSEAAAKKQARVLWSSGQNAGAIAWWRSADLLVASSGSRSCCSPKAKCRR